MKNKKMVINEGTKKKGSVNKPPTGRRPSSPQGQGGSETSGKKTASWEQRRNQQG